MQKLIDAQDAYAALATNGEPDKNVLTQLWADFDEVKDNAQAALDSAIIDPFIGDTFSYWLNLGLTGDSSGNVVQSIAVDADFSSNTAEIHCLQVDETAGSEGTYIRVMNFDGTPSDTAYETAIVGTPLGHQGLVWEDPYYWVGGDNSNTNKIIRYERGVSGVAVEFPFDLTLTDTSGETYDGNITLAVSAQDDLLAIRATAVGTGRDTIFIGSWSAFKASSGAWVANAFWTIDADQDLSGQFFQGLAIDKNFVWIWTGSSTITKNKLFYTYDHEGLAVEKKRAYPGHNFAGLEGDKLEPEGITMFIDDTGAKWLIGVIATGTSGNNINRLYALGDAKARNHNSFGGPVRRSDDVNDVLRRREMGLILRKDAGTWATIGDTPFPGAPTEVRQNGWGVSQTVTEITVTPPVGNFKSIFRYDVTNDHTLKAQHVMAAIKQEGVSADFEIVFHDLAAARGTVLDPADALVLDGTEIHVWIQYLEIMAEDYDFSSL